MSSSLASVFLQSAICTTFGMSVVLKMRNGRAFARTVRAFGIAPRLSGPTAGLVIVAESAVALCTLPASPLAAAGLLLAAFILLLFTGMLIKVLAGADAVPCDCFGPSGGPASRWEVYRNIGLLAAALSGAILVVGPSSRVHQLSLSTMQEAGGTAILLSGVLGIAVACTWSQLPEMARLLRSPAAHAVTDK